MRGRSGGDRGRAFRPSYQSRCNPNLATRGCRSGGNRDPTSPAWRSADPANAQL